MGLERPAIRHLKRKFRPPSNPKLTTNPNIEAVKFRPPSILKVNLNLDNQIGCMQQTTVNVLLMAYEMLQEVVDFLYIEYEKAMENENYADASLLEARAEILFEQAEAIIFVLEEQQNG